MMWYSVVYSLSIIYGTEDSVIGVMKIGNILPNVGIEPISMPFWASVVLLHHIGSLMSLTSEARSCIDR